MPSPNKKIRAPIFIPNRLIEKSKVAYEVPEVFEIVPWDSKPDTWDAVIIVSDKRIGRGCVEAVMKAQSANIPVLHVRFSQADQRLEWLMPNVVESVTIDNPTNWTDCAFLKTREFGPLNIVITGGCTTVLINGISKTYVEVNGSKIPPPPPPPSRVYKDCPAEPEVKSKPNLRLIAYQLG